MIEMRLRGTLKDMEAMIETLKFNYTVLSVSKPYKDGGDSELYRIYIKIEAIEVLG
ncbi:hypothetical protein ACSU6B_23070 [Neobacillus sp. C211]|uniref:hypothetical protein n=1 Tax=unclassified Neobacillus TaxID=2675272 RepID=UPI00397A8F99